jgi:hypothetical protein
MLLSTAAYIELIISPSSLPQPVAIASLPARSDQLMKDYLLRPRSRAAALAGLPGSQLNLVQGAHPAVRPPRCRTAPYS